MPINLFLYHLFVGLREERTQYYLKVISKNLSPGDLLFQGDVGDYYRATVWAYRFFHSKKGAIHMAINPGGVFDPKGYDIQARRVDEYLRPGMKVLELGAGVGFNTDYLAKENPDVSFLASDKTPIQVKRMRERFRGQKNVSVKQLDYENLSEERKFDVIFLVEAFCYSSNNRRDLAGIQKILKPGGHLIIFDGWATKKAKEIYWKQASDWARASMAVRSSWYIDDFKKTAEEKFLLKKEEDFSDDIFPCLLRLQTLAWRFLRRPRLAFIVKKTMPLVAQNSIAGLLMPDLFASGAWAYKMLVFQKEKDF